MSACCHQRALSSEINFHRFVLKNMSKTIVAKVFLGKTVQILGIASQGRWEKVSALCRASLQTRRSLSEILRERKHILAERVVETDELLRLARPDM